MFLNRVARKKEKLYENILYFSVHTYFFIPFGTFRCALLRATAVWGFSCDGSVRTDPSFVLKSDTSHEIDAYRAREAQ